MKTEFKKKVSEVLNSDAGFNVAGVKHMAQFESRAGISSVTSWIGFFDRVGGEDLETVPDYILSETLEKDLDVAIVVCAIGLQKTKYLPSSAKLCVRHGAFPEGERQGAYLESWQNFEIQNFERLPLYTEEILLDADAIDQPRLAVALQLIVKDICDDGSMLSGDWYRARVLYEYFCEYPVSPESAFLSGLLFKELCIKEAYEGDLASYYDSISRKNLHRQRGTEATKKKAEELREFCIELFVSMAETVGPRLMMAPARIQAAELRREALSMRPRDFRRNGKAYSEEWFFRNVIEDQKIQILKRLEQRFPKKA